MLRADCIRHDELLVNAGFDYRSGLVAPTRLVLASAHGISTAAPLTVASMLAQYLLEPLPDRWLHTVAVALRAHQLAVTVNPIDRPVLLAAAWLHDIGYSPLVQDTGFHPLDGARYLEQHGWPGRVAALVRTTPAPNSSPRTRSGR
jgi:HD domain-containing protein